MAQCVKGWIHGKLVVVGKYQVGKTMGTRANFIEHLEYLIMVDHS